MDIQKTLEFSYSDKVNLLAIRGSIYRQLGYITQAIADYEEVLRIRQKINASEYSIGEALSELGFAYLRQGKLLKGMRYCEEGVKLLRNCKTGGFLVRGLRKLSLAYLLIGKFKRAYETWEESKRKALEYGAFDQIKI